MFLTYKEKAKRNKEKIIKRDVKKMKKECMKEFRKAVKGGLDTAYVDFHTVTTSEFQEEISEIVLKELKEEHKNIDFTFSWRHFGNSYKGIKMVAI